MTDNATIWNTLQRNLPKRKWIPLAEILTVVQARIFLDEEDLGPASSRSGTLRWEANVRRLLRLKVHAGIVRSRKK
jgi:hypothetical protein